MASENVDRHPNQKNFFYIFVVHIQTLIYKLI
jgi:hypothetical protein